MYNIIGESIIRTFVSVPWFDKQWKSLGLTDDDLRRLQNELLEDPEKGMIIEGTGGVRKLRFAFENRGKSGSTRVIYIDFLYYEKIYLLTVYGKNQKENLSDAEKNGMKKVVNELLDELKRGERNDTV